MYYNNAEDGKTAVRLEYLDIVATDHKEEVQGKVSHLQNRYNSRDRGIPDRLIGVILMVTDKATVLTKRCTPRLLSLTE